MSENKPPHKTIRCPYEDALSIIFAAFLGGCLIYCVIGVSDLKKDLALHKQMNHFDAHPILR